LIENLDQMRMTRRSPQLGEVAATAAFVNVTSGTFPS
jgi:hypothetical protein